MRKTVLMLIAILCLLLASCDMESFGEDGFLSLDLSYSDYSRTLVPLHNNVNYWEMDIYKAVVDGSTGSWSKASETPEESFVERGAVWPTRTIEIKAGKYLVEAKACYEDENGVLDALGSRPTLVPVTVTKGKKATVAVTVTLDGTTTEYGSLHTSVALSSNLTGYSLSVGEAKLYKLGSTGDLDSLYTSTSSTSLAEGQEVLLQTTVEDGVTTIASITDNTIQTGLYQLWITYTVTPTSGSSYTKTYRENVIIRPHQDSCFRVEAEDSNTVYLGYDKNFLPSSWFEFVSGEGNAIRIKKNFLTNIEGTINIPGSIDNVAAEKIASKAFTTANKLEGVIIPEGIVSIGQNAFYNCSKLEHASFPSTLTTIGDYAFSGCSLTSLELPSSIRTIGVEAFKNNKLLKEIVIPEGTTTIQKYAFQNCSGVKTITIPSTVTSINVGAFRSCSSVTTVNFPEKVKFNTIYSFTLDLLSYLDELSIPEGITTIETYGCSSMIRLTTLTLPSTLSTFHYASFAKAYSVKDIQIASSNKYFQTIRNDADTQEAGIIKKLSASQSLSDATLVFGCYNGASSQKVNGVKEITLPAVKEIFDGAYDSIYCTSSNVVIRVPDTVTTIGDYAFESCTKITDIYLPSTLESISSTAFFGCTSTMKIHYEGTTPFADLVQETASLSMTHPGGGTRVDNGKTYSKDGIVAFYNNSL